MQLVFGAPDLVAAYVAGKIGIELCPPFAAIGMTKDGRTLCGGAVFHNYNGTNIDIGLALSGIVTRGLFRALHHYAFRQAKATRLTAITRRSNRTAREQLIRFGFYLEGVSPRYFGPRKADDGFRFVLFSDTKSKFYG
jgi:RimJ/RimL family protein N-acetyltransferase